MGEPSIRIVCEADAGEILDIYAPYIINTAVTFEYVVPELEQFQMRIKEISADYPYLVCQLNDKIISYAYAHRQMERAAYQWNAELSVYVDQGFHRMGIGKVLYKCLIEILKLQNIYNVYGGAVLPNQSSLKLHQYCGFQEMGVYHNTGFKLGKWHDVLWFEKNIKACESEPSPFIPVRNLDREKVSEIMGFYSKLIKPI